MRDFIVLAIILGSVPLSFCSPYFGVLVWAWVAYFNPHRYAWGFAYDFPVAQVIAVSTLLGILFTRKINRQFLVRETVLLFFLWAWFALTMLYAVQVPLFADHIEPGKALLERVSKILLMTVVMILVVTSRKKLQYLFLVTALSFGFLAIKGTLFGIRTGGQFRVWGPPDSFIADNNDVALAINMSLPMMFFLAREVTNRWLRLLLRVAFLSGIVAVILTYSRGGLLGLAVVLFVIAIKSHRKLLGVASLAVAGFLLLTFAPLPWMSRMETFLRGDLDLSAQLRLQAWEFAWTLAKHHPITGGGFETFTPGLFERYTPGLEFAGPHSIYFQVLGEHGFVGLALFLFLLASCFFTLRRLRRRVRGDPSAAWMVSYAHMLEASLIAYAISGAFLPRAYFDLYFQLVAATIILKILYHREVLAPARASEATALGARVSEPVLS